MAKNKMNLSFLFITIAVILSLSLAFKPNHHVCRLTKLYSDDYKKGEKKGFGRKKIAVVEPEQQKQPFNARLVEKKTTPVVDGDNNVTVTEEKKVGDNLYQTPRARREAELDEKIARLKEEEDLIATDTSVGAVPELVANRMIGRIIAFFGIPVFGGLAIFVGAFFYSKKYDLVVPPSIIAYATQVPFVLGKS
jgi:hypothetical protein